MVSFRHETPIPICAGPGCTKPVPSQTTGRPGRYCSGACRSRAHRRAQQANDTPVYVEVDHGSASSRGRPPEQAWMVRLRRGDHSLIIAIGLRRHAAERLSHQIADLLNGAPSESP